MRKVDLEVEIFAPGQSQGKTAIVKAVWQALEVLKQKHPGVKGRKTQMHLGIAVEYGIMRG